LVLPAFVVGWPDKVFHVDDDAAVFVVGRREILVEVVVEGVVETFVVVAVAAAGRALGGLLQVVKVSGVGGVGGGVVLRVELASP
jgi:hypothetical protein